MVVLDGDFVPSELEQLVEKAAREAGPNAFEALRYCVFSAAGPVDVKVAVDESGGVEVTVFDEPNFDDEDGLYLLSA
jgi:hypothetical protein